MIPKLQNQNQRVLQNNKSIEEFFLRFNRKNILLIDPSLEYLLYEFYAGKFLRTLGKIRETKQLDILLHYLEKRDTKKQTLAEDEYEPWKKAFHRKFWYDLDRNPAERSKFVGDFLDLETMCGTDIVIPPIPIVYSEGACMHSSHTILEHTFRFLKTVTRVLFGIVTQSLYQIFC